MRCLIGIALAKVILVQHPAGAEGIEHGTFSRVRLPAFRVGTNLADRLAHFLEDNREKILGFLCPLDHFFPHQGSSASCQRSSEPEARAGIRTNLPRRPLKKDAEAVFLFESPFLYLNFSS